MHTRLFDDELEHCLVPGYRLLVKEKNMQILLIGHNRLQNNTYVIEIKVLLLAKKKCTV